VDLVVPEVE